MSDFYPMLFRNRRILIDKTESLNSTYLFYLLNIKSIIYNYMVRLNSILIVITPALNGTKRLTKYFANKSTNKRKSCEGVISLELKLAQTSNCCRIVF